MSLVEFLSLHDTRQVVLGWLGAVDLLRFSLVCKEFYIYSQEELLWKDLVWRDFQVNEIIEDETTWKGTYKVLKLGFHWSQTIRGSDLEVSSSRLLVRNPTRNYLFLRTEEEWKGSRWQCIELKLRKLVGWVGIGVAPTRFEIAACTGWKEVESIWCFFSNGYINKTGDHKLYHSSKFYKWSDGDIMGLVAVNFLLYLFIRGELSSILDMTKSRMFHVHDSYCFILGMGEGEVEIQQRHVYNYRNLVAKAPANGIKQ